MGSLVSIATCGAQMRKSTEVKAAKRPNVIVIFTDDQGYADVGCFGATGFKTPNIDKMAQNGMKFTNFYVASSVCSPSRAALLTGCYPQRVDIPAILFPKHQKGLNSNEMTIASMFKQVGYTTACVGKWHLGHLKGALPLQHGFDQFFGLPYSNDMKPPTYPDLPLIKGNEVIEYNPDQDQLTTRYTEYAKSFIRENKNHPFFLYLAHSMPHIPLHVSDKFRGKSEKGLYGDVIMEIDWSIGEIYKTLRENGIADNTLVIYTSDNGPWLTYGNHGGSVGSLREGKNTSFEGGQRSFCLMTWPSVIPSGKKCSELVTSMDILPTMAHYVRSKLPDHKIDGMDIFPLIAGTNAKTPHESFYYYHQEIPEAIRQGDWKLVLPHDFSTVIKPGVDGASGVSKTVHIGRSLFNLKEDISETKNCVDELPDLADKMEKALLEFDKEVKANVRKSGIY